MDPVGEKSEANRSSLHLFGSVNAREISHPSELAWVSHWKHIGRTPASQGNFKLPYLGMGTRQDPSQNPPLRSRNQNRFRKIEACLDASCSKAKESCRDRHGSVEVRPALLRPVEKVVAESNTTGNADALFELVTGSPTSVAYLSPSPVQPLYPLSPASHPKHRPLEGVTPLFPSDKTINVFFPQETNNLEVSPVESSLPHANGRSCEAQSFPLLLKESEVENWSYAKAKDLQLNLENQPYQLFTPTFDNNRLSDSKSEKDNLIVSDSKSEKDNLIVSDSDGLIHGMMLNPSQLKSCGYSEDKIRQASCALTTEGHIKFSNFTYRKDGHCGSGSHLEFPYTEVKVNTKDEKRRIHHLYGESIQRFCSVEFTQGTSKYTHGSKFVGIPCIVPKSNPACSLHDLTLRIQRTVVEVERVPGDSSKFSKTTQHFLISKRTGVSLPEEEHSTQKSDLPKEYFRGSHDRSSGHTEDRLHKRHKGIASLKYVSGDAIRASDDNSDASYHQSCTLPNSMENEKLRYEINDSEYLVDPVHGKANNYYDLSNEPPCTRDRVDLKVADTCGQTGDATHKIRFSTNEQQYNFTGLVLQLPNPRIHLVVKCFQYSPELKTLLKPPHFPLDKESESLNWDYTNLSRNMGLSSCSNLNGHAKKAIFRPSPHNLVLDDLRSCGDQSSSMCASSGTVSDPSIRCAKHLENSHFKVLDIKKSSIEDTYNEVKGIKLFNKVFNYSKCTCRAPLSSGMYEPKLKALGAATSPQWNKSDAKILRENKETTSSPWIQRLCSLGFRGMQMESAETTEPECPRMISGVKSKQFRSIRAMALMTKALCNFSPHGFSKAGL